MCCVCICEFQKQLFPHFALIETLNGLLDERRRFVVAQRGIDTDDLVFGFSQLFWLNVSTGGKGEHTKNETKTFS